MSHGRHRRFVLRAHLRALTAALTAVALAVLGASVVLTRTSALAASSGTVSGVAFEDYDSNGVQDTGSITPATAAATDRGLAGAVVTATDSTGTVVGSATSASDGSYSITVTSAASTALRVHFGAPAGFTTGPHGGTSGSTVQFVTLGATGVDAGFVRQGDYAQDTPPLLAVEQVAAIGSGGTPTLLTQTAKATLTRTAYNQRGTQANTTITTEATATQTGAVWGLAQLGAKYAFTSAYFKRHSRTGPGGLGAIYLTDTSQSSPNATQIATIPNAGTNPRAGESTMSADDWFHDTAAFPQVGKIGLGAMAIAPDNSALYVVNLNNQHLYKVPLTTGSGAPSAGTPVDEGMPLALPGAATGCAAADVRPFGVSAQNGALWVTLTCVGPASTDLRGYVYRYSPSSNSFGSAPAFETALSGYTRGAAYSNCSTCSATWRVWPATDTTWPTTPSGTSNVSVASPEPLLSDVVFDADGDMTIGVKDRFGDQVGYEDGNLSAGDNTSYEGFDAGDVLRACASGTTWTLESAGRCGTLTGYKAANNQGPGGGEFYNDDFGSTHAQTSLGALLQLPGYGQVIDTSFDPDGASAVRTEGYRFFSNTDGTFANGAAGTGYHTLLDTVSNTGSGSTQGSFAKGGGLGDITALVTAAPIEIGNRVWQDTDGNGIQDAGEPGLAGVTVDLYAADGTTPLATAVTDSRGEYYFSNATGTSTASAIDNLSTLVANTAYSVRVDRAADFAGGGALQDYVPTRTAAGADRDVDSNGATSNGVDRAAVTTGADGTNDHSIDFGFVQPVSVGDYVWEDTDHDGVQDPTETGLGGVGVTLARAGGGAPLQPDGTPVPSTSTTTAPDGSYAFTGLAPGAYTVTVATPAGYYPTVTGGTADTTQDSSTGTASTTLTSGQHDSSLDFGFVQPVTVGDFVWDDIDRDGVQDGGEPGVPGVRVTVTGPGGAAVTDINGNTVGAATTDAAGAYHFGNLPVLAAGQSYTVHVDNDQTALKGQKYLPTRAGAGSDPGLDSSTSSVSTGDLSSSGAADDSLDFGFYLPAVSVGDRVFVDGDGDGVQQDDDTGVANVRVTITTPGGNPVTDIDGKPVGAQLTDLEGYYAFTGLPTLNAGQGYTVHLDDSQPALAAAGYLPTRTGGTSDTDRDSSTGAATSTADLTADGGHDLGLDFGFVQPVTVGDFVWQDTNRNGVQDGGEPGIPDVTVTLARTDGGTVQAADGTALPAAQRSTTTDQDGGYAFTGLAPGQYTVTVATPAGFIATTPQAGDTAGDSSTGSADSLTLASGGTDDSLDFGFIVPAVGVGDFVWRDTDRDGVQDDGEPGIPDVVVALTGPGGAAVTDV